MAQLNELLVTGASQLLNGLGILGSTNADSILPNSTNTYSLGSSEKKWKEAYITSVIGNADSATVLKNARTLTIGKTGKTFNGSANVSWTLAEIGAVAKAGDTMTGFLTLHANPTANLHAATKQYVDKTIENAAKLFTTTTTITTDTASSVVFDTSTVTLSTCLIYYNGLLMTPGVNYSITNNTTIALSGWTANKGDIFTVSGKQADETSIIAAGKLTCGTVGSSTKPVYFENGIPVECTSIEDKKVTQSETTASNYRPVVLGYTDNTDASKLATSVTNQVYVSTKFYAQPSTGTFVATKFKGALEGNASTATKATQDGNGNVITSTYLPLSGGTITGTSGDTPLYLKSASTATWLGFKNSSGTNLGFFGFSGTNIPSVYLDKTYKLLHDGNYNSYSPTLTGGGASGIWSISVGGSATSLSRNDDLNMTSRGVSWFDIDGKAGAVSLVNDTPTNGWWHILRFNHENTNEYYTDLAVPFNYNSLYYKRVAGGTVESNKWIQVLDEKNYTTYAPTKTGGGASGTWPISISGSAGSVSWGNVSGKPDFSRAPIVYTINLSSYSTSNFYFVDFGTSTLELDCEIHSRGASAGDSWNQNVLHFLMVGQGWSDTPKNLTILNQSFYDGNEKTIMSIVHGNQAGVRGVYLRGGLTYTIKSNFAPNLNTTTKTSGNESYASGTTSYTTITNATTLWTNDGVNKSIFSMPVNAVMLSSTDYTTYRGRSIAANTSALTSGSSSLSDGYIYVQYE